MTCALRMTFLNKSHPHVWVDFCAYSTIDGDEQRLWSWITDIPLTTDNVTKILESRSCTLENRE